MSVSEWRCFSQTLQDFVSICAAGCSFSKQVSICIQYFQTICLSFERYISTWEQRYWAWHQPDIRDLITFGEFWRICLPYKSACQQVVQQRSASLLLARAGANCTQHFLLRLHHLFYKPSVAFPMFLDQPWHQHPYCIYSYVTFPIGAKGTFWRFALASCIFLNRSVVHSRPL